MYLGQVSETFSPAEDQSWLGSAHGTQSGESVTLDGSELLTVFTDGVVPSGVVLAKITASGLYAQYDDAETDGTEDAVGFLFTTVDVTSAGLDVGATILTHCKVREANLPTNHGLDAAAKVDMGDRVQFTLN